MRIKCDDCAGVGYVACDADGCNGSGLCQTCCRDCDNCGGSGTVECDLCGGDGSYEEEAEDDLNLDTDEEDETDGD